MSCNALRHIAAAWVWLPATLAAQEPRWADAGDRQPELRQLVAPRLPSSIPESSLPIEVRLRGTLSAAGELASVSFDPGTDARVAGALERAIPQWRFRPSIDPARCEPVALPISATVSLDATSRPGGALRVLVAIDASREAAVERRPPATPPRLSVAPRPRIPEAAHDTKAEGIAELAALIDEAGRVARSRAVLSIPLPDFAEEALAVAPRIAVETSSVAAAPAAPRCLLLAFQFCLGGRADYPQAACAAARR